MKTLLRLHDKVKEHRYRENIVANAAHHRRYTDAFGDLLDAFQEEINAAKKTAPADRSKGQQMLIELENRCFMIDARHKLSALSALAESYRHDGNFETEQRIRILMAQLETTLSSIHEYIAYGKIAFIVRYADDESMQSARLTWKGTDYV